MNKGFSRVLQHVMFGCLAIMLYVLFSTYCSGCAATVEPGPETVGEVGQYEPDTQAPATLLTTHEMCVSVCLSGWQCDHIGSNFLPLPGECESSCAVNEAEAGRVDLMNHNNDCTYAYSKFVLCENEHEGQMCGDCEATRNVWLTCIGADTGLGR